MKIKINFSTRCFLLLLFFQILSSTSYGQKNEIKFEYLDGNGNAYVIYEDKIDYIPVQSSESSSGTYDGGEPILKKITPADYDTLNSIIQEIISDKSLHINERVKLSGLIKIYESNDVYAYIISPESEQLLILEKKLREFIE